MKRILVWIVLAAVLGLAAGYLIFARGDGGYLSVKTLLRPSRGALDELVRSVRGIQKIRESILLCGALGAGIGLVGGLLSARGSRGRRRR